MSHMKTCPHCGEMVLFEAKVCSHCTRFIREAVDIKFIIFVIMIALIIVSQVIQIGVMIYQHVK
jgi:uncharacterized protein (DUF983 family)